ncbi:MAG: hypothetical protein H6579_09655 [Chitinophagales bacterium]|nr:hypothetical protein [Chitinophagales bacterium]
MFEKASLFLLLTLLFFRLEAQSCEDIDIIVKNIQEFHFAPPKFDEAHAEAIIQSSIQSLDPYHFIFLQEDIKALLEYRHNFFTEETYCSFINDIKLRFEQGFIKANTLFDKFEISKQSIPADKKFEFKTAKDSFFTNEKDREAYWNSWFIYKYNTSKYQLSILDSKWTNTQLETAFEERVSCFFDYFFSEESLDEFVLTASLDALMRTCDPHSNFFSTELKEEFVQDLSKEILSFGFTVKENEQGDLLVDKVLPNGPAWNSKLIQEDDQILSFLWDDGEEDLLLCINSYKINQKLLNKKRQQVSLKLKNKEGLIVSCSLSKAMLKNESNAVDGFILDGSNKIAYIALPSFYRNEESGFGCASDLGKELLVLKRDGIEGLILDLRYNGGGSIQEAVDLAGIFINEGPLMLDSTSADSKVSIVKDPNRGIMYNGPLLVLYNGFSASASEMFASIMRSYNRALLVGSSSYGKATGQVILPVEKSGFIKLTISQYTPLDGISYQKHGVGPDIFLPEEYDAYLSKEADEDFVIEPIHLKKKVYFSPLKEIPIEKLKAESMARVAQDSTFIKIKQANLKMQEFQDSKNIVALHYETYVKDKTAYKYFADNYGKLVSEKRLYEVSFTSFQKELIQMDDTKEINLNVEAEKILKDAYIQESYYIITNLLNAN